MQAYLNETNNIGYIVLERIIHPFDIVGDDLEGMRRLDIQSVPCPTPPYPSQTERPHCSLQ